MEDIFFKFVSRVGDWERQYIIFVMDFGLVGIGGYWIQNDQLSMVSIIVKKRYERIVQVVVVVEVWQRLKGMLESSIGKNFDMIVVIEIVSRNMCLFLMVEQSFEKGFVFGEKRMECEVGWVERVISWKGVMVFMFFDLIVSEYDFFLDGDEKGGFIQKEGLLIKCYYYFNNC